jgi:hypothetical protein
MLRRAVTVAGASAALAIVAAAALAPGGGAAPRDHEPRRRVTLVLGTDAAAGGSGFPLPVTPIDRLGSGDVLDITITGADEFGTGSVSLCLESGPRRCGLQYPVQFDVDGRARLLFVVEQDFLAPGTFEGGCRSGATTCSLVVRSRGLEAARPVLFVDAAPPLGIVRVAPRVHLVDGSVVTVSVEGFPPGITANATLCHAPALGGAQRCGSPGPVVPLVVGPDGRGEVQLTVAAGPVGRDRLPCGRGSQCAVAVLTADGAVRAPVAPISFAAPEDADYSPARLAAGLAVAAAFLLIAFVLFRRTDWSATGGAAAPEIDEAVYADLDAIIAALPPEEDASIGVA